MTLVDLGNQYLVQELTVKRRIAQLRPELKKVRGNEHKALESRLQLLYLMARDCRSTGDYLKYYYDGVDCDEKANFKS